MSDGYDSPAAADGWARSFFAVGTVVLVGVLLIYLQAILVPFVLAIFLAYMVRPLAELIAGHLCFWRRSRRERLKKDAFSREEVARLLPDEERSSPSPQRRPRLLTGEVSMVHLAEAGRQLEESVPLWVGVLLALSLAMILFASVIVLMSASISSLGNRLDAYQHRVRDLWSIVVYMLEPLGLHVPESTLQLLPSQAISSYLQPLLISSLGLLNDFLLVLIFLVFLLLEPSAPRSSLRKRVDNSISRYIILKSLVCLGLASWAFVVFSALDFPLALFLAIATYILTFIPNLGPLLAVCLPLPICLLDVSVAPNAGVLAVLLPGIAHVVVGNVLEPYLFGSQFRMSPVIILFSIGVW